MDVPSGKPSHNIGKGPADNLGDTAKGVSGNGPHPTDATNPKEKGVGIAKITAGGSEMNFTPSELGLGKPQRQ